MSIRTILFDLDGTLTDPKQGITTCIQYALERLSRPIPPVSDLEWCIGPPLLDSLRRLLGNACEADAQEALRLYRERFDRIGKFENRLYAGVPQMLEQLRNLGMVLIVATGKPLCFASQILEFFTLSPYFDGVYGSELSGKFTDKTELIAHVIGSEGLDPDATIMVGDRDHDVVGAKRCGLRAIGVSYGYGGRQELLEAGADWIARNPQDIVHIVTAALGRS